MLCHEDRMPAVGRLLPILVRSRRRKALGDELGGVLANGLHATKLDRGPVAPAQVELRAKALTPDGVEAAVDELDVLHRKLRALLPDSEWVAWDLNPEPTD
jgi:hypothetical protein